MGTTHIEISHRHSRSPSVASHPDDLNENGVQISPSEVSPPFSIIQPQSQSGSSSHPGEYVHLEYPNEIRERGDLNPSDSASRLDSTERRPPRPSRSNSSIRRTQSHPHHPTREQGRPRGRDQRGASPTESGDSTEDFLARPDPGGMPRPQSYYGPNGYTHSSSSGSYYPAQNQIVPIQPPPHPYPPQYPPQMSGPPPMGYAHPPGYQPQYHHPGSQVSSPYSSPYGPPSVIQYPGPASGYFTPQYSQPYPQYPPQYMQYPPPHMIPPYVDAYRVHSPALHHGQPAQSPPASDVGSAKIDQEEIIKRVEALMKAQSDERSKSEVDKEDAFKQAMAQAKKEAQAAADRAAAESRIREDARLEAIRTYEEKTRQAAEQATREQQIRKEATEAALRVAAEEATKRTERAAYEKRIAEDAAAAAKSAAAKDAAEAAAAAEAVAKKAQEEAEKKLKDAEKAAKEAQEEADKKLKEAEDAAAKAKAEAEKAEKDLKNALPVERKKPVRFKDALNRNYNFPYDRCCKWRDMESLINQAFAHVNEFADRVYDGKYDLLGPAGEIIMPQYWESTIEPDMTIRMMLWELPQEDKHGIEAISGPDDDGIMNLDDILNPGGGGGGGGGRRRRGEGGGSKKKRPTSRPGALGMWMLGGAPKKGSSVKGDKKPGVAAGSQHDEGEGSCIVM